MPNISRRRVLRTFSALPFVGLASALPVVARAAEISYKYGTNLPLAHPLNVRAKEAADEIREKSKGRVDIAILPNNQLGCDNDMLAQVRACGMQLFTPSSLVIATLVPSAAIK